MRIAAIIPHRKLALRLAVFAFDPLRCVVPQTAALAAQFPPGILITEGKSARGFPYITGGVSSDERAAMEEMAKGFNVKLVFAAKDDSFLANVKITIASGKGTGAFATTSTGPWFYIQLPPGSYRVMADFEGRKKEIMALGVAKSQRVYRVFVWDLAPAKAPAA